MVRKRALFFLLLAAYVGVSLWIDIFSGARMALETRQSVQGAVPVQAIPKIMKATKVAKGTQKSYKLMNGMKVLQKSPIPDSQIDELAKVSVRPKELNNAIGKMRWKGVPLEDDLRADVFLRVAVKKRVLSVAEELEIRKMGNVRGLSSLLSKINSVNKNQVKGHLQELRIGLEIQKQGGRVLEFGKKFHDGLKNACTDVDVLASMNGKVFAIESKAYGSHLDTLGIRNDIHSLEYYCKNMGSDAKPVFCFKEKPSQVVSRLLKEKKISYTVETTGPVGKALQVLSENL